MAYSLLQEGYHMYLYRETNTQKTRRFGIDLEIRHANHSHADFKQHLEDKFPFLTVKGDASLRSDESELCFNDSFEAKDNTGVQAWKDILSELESLGCSVSHRCGYHIHWDVQDCTPKAVFNMLAFWYNHSRLIDLALPEVRRGSPVNIRAITRRDMGKLKRVVTHCEDVQDFLRQADRILGHTREIAVNSRFGTIEFRKQQATMRKDIFEMWIKFTQNIVKKAIRRNTYTSLKTENERYMQIEMMATDLDVPNSLGKDWRKVFQYTAGNRTQFKFWTDRATAENTDDIIKNRIKMIQTNIEQKMGW